MNLTPHSSERHHAAIYAGHSPNVTYTNEYDDPDEGILLILIH